jgi:catechol 2,3-dioxygenase-like lactoylglutathione lyase family enzyme
MRLVEIARFVSDVPAAVASYRQLLGVPPVHESPGIAVFEVGELTWLLHERYESGPGDLPPEDHLAFAAADLEAACDELAAAGYTVERAPADYDWGRSAYLRDLDGRLIEIVEKHES